MVYDTVYVPAVLEPGVISPVEEFILKPAGKAVKVPPGLPAIVTLCAPASLHHGDPV